MSRRIKPITVADQIIKIAEFPSYTFVRLEGGKRQQDLAEYGDGINKTRAYAPAVRSFDEITISKPFKPLVDIPLLEKLEEYYVSAKELTVIQSTARKLADDYEAGDVIVTYKECLVVSNTFPNYDDIGTDVAMIEVVLQPGQVIAGQGRQAANLSDDFPTFNLNTSIFDQLDLNNIF